MAPFPHSVLAVLDGGDGNCRWDFYAKTNFAASNTWVAVKFAPDWHIALKTNGAMVLKANPPNEELEYGDDTAATAQRMSLFAWVRGDCTVKVGGVAKTETLFLGRLWDGDPADEQFDFTAYCRLHDLAFTTGFVNEEATRIALTAGAVLDQLTDNGYTDVWALDAAHTTGFIDGNASNPRRPLAPSNIVLYDDNGDPVPLDKYRLVPPQGAIQLTDASVVTPLTADGIEVYQEGTLDISDPIKTLLATAKIDRGPGCTSANWLITRNCSTGCTTTVLTLQEGCRHLFPYHNVTVSGETRRITERDLAAGTITLDAALSGAPANGTDVVYDTLNVGIDIQQAKWSNGRGSIMDYLQRMREQAGDTVAFGYCAEHDVFELRRSEQAASADYTLSEDARVSISQGRSLSTIFSCFVLTGELESPVNLLRADNFTPNAAVITDPIDCKYYDGSSQPTYADGSTFDPALWFDGLNNTAAGVHDGLDLDTYYNVGYWTLDAETDLRGLLFTAAPTQNQGAPGEYRQSGVIFEGSLDNVTYFVISPAFDRRLLDPSERVLVEEDQIFQGRAGYVRLWIKPAKDGNDNWDDPLLGAGEVGAYEFTRYEVKAQVQDTDPAGVVLVRVPYEPYQLELSTYYPDFLERTGGLQLVAPPEDLADTLNEVKAQELAWLKVHDAMKRRQSVDANYACNPYLRLGDTVELTDRINGDWTGLVETLDFSLTHTQVEGTDFNGGGL